MTQHASQLNFADPVSELLRALVSVRSPDGRIIAADLRFNVYASILTAQEGQQLLSLLGDGTLSQGIQDSLHGDIIASLQETLKENLIPALQQPTPPTWGHYFKAS